MSEVSLRSGSSLFNDGRVPIPGIDTPYDDRAHGVDLLNELNRSAGTSGRLSVSEIVGVDELGFTKRSTLEDGAADSGNDTRLGDPSGVAAIRINPNLLLHRPASSIDE